MGKKSRIEPGKKHGNSIKEHWRVQLRTPEGNPPYNLPNPALVDFVRKHLGHNPSRIQEILDIGSKEGLYTHQLSGNRKLVSLDLHETKALPHKIPRKFMQGDAERIPFPENSFDAVTALRVLEYVDIEKAVEEIKRVLRPGGKAIATLVHPNGFHLSESRRQHPFERKKLELMEQIVDGRILNEAQLTKEVDKVNFESRLEKLRFLAELKRALYSFVRAGKKNLPNYRRMIQHGRSKIETVKHLLFDAKYFNSQQEIIDFFKAHGFSNVEIETLRQPVTGLSGSIGGNPQILAGEIFAYGVKAEKP